jgi:hypothetical protein
MFGVSALTETVWALPPTDIGIVATERDGDVLVLNHQPVGRVEVDPAVSDAQIETHA